MNTDWSNVLTVSLIVMAIPVVITILVIRNLLKVKRAAAWVETRARITKSEMTAERHQFSGEAPTVTNKPAVVYEFSVGAETYQGERISVTDGTSGRADEILKRYPVGAAVPVFYNPAKPQECALERTAPVSTGCLAAGVAFVLLAGAAITMGILRGGSINDALTNAFPSINNPLMAICVGLMGLFCLMMYWAGRRQAAAAAAWPATGGRIVSSTVESVVQLISKRKVTMYQPVVEFAYQVQGQEYRSTQISFGASVAYGTRALAEAEAARYPNGQTVVVHYDPQNPVNAVLEQKFARGLGLLVLAAALFAVAAYAALHP